MNLRNIKSVHVSSNIVTQTIDVFGFKVVGRLENFVSCQGEHQDLVISQLSKQKWQARNKINV